METPLLRTFCVIPHEARDADFFDAVFEDGVRVVHDGRLHSLLFSHVLSPAHDIAAHIIGPLLDRVRRGTGAALVVALPTDDHSEDTNTDINRASGEKLAVAADIFATILPLLFRSAERCNFARVSVIAFRVGDQAVHDLLQPRATLRSERDAKYELIARDGSSARWGSVMQLLHDRHAQLESGTHTTISDDDVFVVRVELEGYGKIVLAEVGCGRATLQSLTMLFGADAFPPRGPLIRLLRESLRSDGAAAPPAAHIVGLPDPVPAPRATMRLLRFLAGLQRTEKSASREDSAKRPIGRRAHAEIQRTQQDVAQQDWAHPYAWQAAAGPFAPTTANANAIATSTSATEGLTGGGGGGGGGGGPTWEWGPPGPPPRGLNTSGALDSSGAGASREQALISRAAALDHENRELTAALAAARAEARHVASQKAIAQDALRQKQDAILEAAATHERAHSENADYAKLVPRLMRRVKEITRERDEARDSARRSAAAAKSLRDETERLRSRVTQLQREARAVQRRETQRARDNTLSRIDRSHSPQKQTQTHAQGQAQKQKQRPSPSPSPHPQQRSRRSVSALAARNSELEAALRALRSESCASCVSLRRQLSCAAEELRQAKTTTTTTTTAAAAATTIESRPLRGRALDDTPDIITSVSAALAAGCESLCAQLSHLEAAVAQRMCVGVSPQAVREHSAALAAVAAAVRDIGGRRLAEQRLPLCATAADAEGLSAALAFEAERGARLRAFVPTFAQLAVATEHLRMRMGSSHDVSRESA